MSVSTGLWEAATPSAALTISPTPISGSTRARSATGDDDANSTVKAPDAAVYPSAGWPTSVITAIGTAMLSPACTPICQRGPREGAKANRLTLPFFRASARHPPVALRGPTRQMADVSRESVRQVACRPPIRNGADGACAPNRLSG
ncbi:hypothetical protein [uncultured Microbacterium sp.]|uniref:hypothetical protein n=1 Tax=uncultured Microbacterium sp. TaxID=191216 RepID=UPI00260ADBE2|nr:hypothetical protein [uncultured Microbacterium sp.]